MSKPTGMRLLQKILSESVFNPKDGPLALIVQQKNPTYIELRAIEMIQESNLALGSGPTPDSQQLERYHHKMKQAISLLAMARLLRSKE